MRRTLVVFILLISVAAILLWGKYHREPDLVAEATRVARVEAWDIDRGPDSCKAFFWSSPTEVVHLAERHTPNNPYAEVGFYRLDARTGTSTRLDGLTKAFQRADPADVQGSPDGQWVLWRRENAILAASTATPMRHKFPSACRFGGKLIWLSDSRRFLEFEWDAAMKRYTAVHLYNLDNPGTPKRFPVDAANPLNESSYQDALLSTGERLILVQNKDKDWWENPTGFANIHELRLSEQQGLIKIQEYRVRLPENACLQNAVISPEGKRIAWQFGFTYRPSFPQPVYRLLPMLHPRTRHATALWISRLDGTDMRSAGSIAEDPEDRAPPPLDDLRWLPDGSRLSFITQKPDSHNKWIYTLYTLPL